LLKKELTRFCVSIILKHQPSYTQTPVCGLGAILQEQFNNKWSPIAYFRQTVNKTEINYYSFELEMLAIVRAVRFHIYLYGIGFTIITDCNALFYAINKANLNPRIARWTLKHYSWDIIGVFLNREIYLLNVIRIFGRMYIYSFFFLKTFLRYTTYFFTIL